MTRRPLRTWQAAFARAFAAHTGESFLLNAAPGAGKTVAAAHALRQAWDQDGIARVIVVCPTTHLRGQWSDALAPWGLDVDPHYANEHASIARDMHGIVVTYQQVAAAPALFAMLCGQRRTAVVLDEVHHAGDQASWGRAVTDAFVPAALRLCLSGTPFRQDKAAIPYVTYDDRGYAQPDYTYGYAQSIVDGVCRPVEFVLRDAEATWEYGDEEITASFDTPLDPVDAARRLRTVVSPDCAYMRDVLVEADAHLSAVRAVKPDAGGLVLAETQRQARDIAALLEQSTGHAPAIALSEDKDSDRAIAEFTSSDSRWIVAVRKISEGTDIPRLCVEVWATRWRAELFFRQAVGRVVRRQATDPTDLAATVFLPADPTLRELARRLEDEVTYRIDAGLEPLQDVEPNQTGARDDQFTALEATPGEQELVYGGRRFTAAQIEFAQKILRATGRAGADLGLTLTRMADEGVLPGPVARAAAAPVGPVADLLPGETKAQAKKRLKAEVTDLCGEWGTYRELTDPSFDWPFCRSELNKQLGISGIKDATVEDLQAGVAWLTGRLRGCARENPLVASQIARDRRAESKPTIMGPIAGYAA